MRSTSPVSAKISSLPSTIRMHCRRCKLLSPARASTSAHSIKLQSTATVWPKSNCCPREMNANPQYSKNVADSLGLPNTSLLMDAASNPIAAAKFTLLKFSRLPQPILDMNNKSLSNLVSPRHSLAKRYRAPLQQPKFSQPKFSRLPQPILDMNNKSLSNLVSPRHFLAKPYPTQLQQPRFSQPKFNRLKQAIPDTNNKSLSNLVSLQQF